MQRNYRFEYFLLYFYTRVFLYDTKHAFQSGREYIGGLCATNLPPCNIREEILAGVSRISRETGRGTNEFERLPKRGDATRRDRACSPRSHHVLLRSSRREAGKFPNARNKRTRDRKRALQVVIIRGPGADSHVVRSRRTTRVQAPSAAPGVKLNFGYAGCAKCLSRAMRRSAF